MIPLLQDLCTALIIAAVIVVGLFSKSLLGNFLGFEVLILTPLRGIVVRFLVNYRPKDCLVTVVEGADSPVINSFFAMSRKVYKIEGWSGLYKGLMPNLITRGAILFTIANILGRDNAWKLTHKYLSPIIGLNGFIHDLVTTAICLPLLVITNRAITTPYKLPWLKPMRALRVLFTSSECRRPWNLATLGIFIPQLIILRCRHNIMPLLMAFLEKDPTNNMKPEELWNHKLRIVLLMSLLYGIALLSAAILCPLEVISTRLSVQRTDSAAAIVLPLSPIEDVQPEEGAPKYAIDQEDVVRLRNEHNPYTGFFDCAKMMVRQEGFQSLFRGWWIIFFVHIYGSPST